MNLEIESVTIPKDLFNIADLSWSDKLLLTIIDGLDKDENHCSASNEALATIFGCKPASIANQISRLKTEKYLIQTFFDGKNRRLKCSEKLKNIFKKASQKNEASANKLHKKMNEASQKNEASQNYEAYPSQKNDGTEVAKIGISLNREIDRNKLASANPRESQDDYIIRKQLEFPHIDVSALMNRFVTYCQNNQKTATREYFETWLKSEKPPLTIKPKQSNLKSVKEVQAENEQFRKQPLAEVAF